MVLLCLFPSIKYQFINYHKQEIHFNVMVDYLKSPYQVTIEIIFIRENWQMKAIHIS